MLKPDLKSLKPEPERDILLLSHIYWELHMRSTNQATDRLTEATNNGHFLITFYFSLSFKLNAEQCLSVA